MQLDFELCYILQVIAIWFRLDGPLCIFGQLIFRKIVKIVATRGQILKLKCTKFDFGCGSAPDAAGGAFSAPPGRGVVTALKPVRAEQMRRPKRKQNWTVPHCESVLPMWSYSLYTVDGGASTELNTPRAWLAVLQPGGPNCQSSCAVNTPFESISPELQFANSTSVQSIWVVNKA